VLAFAGGGKDAAALLAAPAEATGKDRIAGPLQPGAAGAPVFDRSGALAGLVGPMPEAPRLIAGVAPPTTYPLVPAAAVAAFLEAAGVAVQRAAAGGAKSAGEIAGAAGAAVAAIECAEPLKP
jgi:hypothetical protein